MAKRETMGSRLKSARLKLQLSAVSLSEKINQSGAPIGASTIRGIENDKTPNPGIKTIEPIAHALGLPPLEVIALALVEPPPESSAAFTESRFAALWKAYSCVRADKQAVIDDHIEMLIDRINKAHR